MNPSIGGNYSPRSQTGTVIELPAVHAVKRPYILDCVVIKGRTMRPEVDPFIFLRGLNPEENARVSPYSSFHGNIAFYDTVFEFDVLQKGRSYQSLAVEIVNDLGVRKIPAFRPKGNNIAGCRLRLISRG
jgi:hypothetical protein